MDGLDTAGRARLYLITGVMAAGKSTVAQRLAERFPRSVHLRGDAFRRMIVNGRAELGAELSEEAAAQLQLRYQIAADAARLYLDAGFTVVYQDIFLGAGLTDGVSRLGGMGYELRVVVLCPTVETVAAREAGRGKRGYGSAGEITAFDRILREGTPRIGLWLDTSDLNPDETADRILAETGATPA